MPRHSPRPSTRVQRFSLSLTAAALVIAFSVSCGRDVVGPASVDMSAPLLATVAGPTASPMVAAGLEHTCALKSDATVVCWGYNGFGQTDVPAGLGDVTQVSLGFYHTCGL